MRGVEICRREIEEQHRADGYHVGFNHGAATGWTVSYHQVRVIEQPDRRCRDTAGLGIGTDIATPPVSSAGAVCKDVSSWYLVFTNFVGTSIGVRCEFLHGFAML
jgi:hypothetical protein